MIQISMIICQSDSNSTRSFTETKFETKPFHKKMINFVETNFLVSSFLVLALLVSVFFLPCYCYSVVADYYGKNTFFLIFFPSKINSIFSKEKTVVLPASGNCNKNYNNDQESPP